MTILVSLWALMCIAVVCFLAGYAVRTAQEIRQMRRLHADVAAMVAIVLGVDEVANQEPN